jgi:hypothetical protein
VRISIYCPAAVFYVRERSLPTCPVGPTACANATVVSPCPQPNSRILEPGAIPQNSTIFIRWDIWAVRPGELFVGSGRVCRNMSASSPPSEGSAILSGVGLSFCCSVLLI